jgi:outer membrane protein TolC
MKIKLIAAVIALVLINSGIAAFAEDPLTFEQARPFSHGDLFNVDMTKAGSEEPVRLSLAEMIALSRQNRLEGALSAEKINEAEAQRWQAVAPLLPQLDAGVSEGRTYRLNLDAQGLRGSGAIGPFNIFDARLKLVQRIIDVSAASGLRSARARVNAARYTNELTRQKIIVSASLLYLEALRAQGAYHAAEARLALSNRLLRQAQAHKAAGIAASIDVARAMTREAQDTLYLERSRTAVHDAYLEIQRSTGIGYARIIELMSSLAFFRDPLPSVNEALAAALKQRLDMRIYNEQVHAAEGISQSSRGQRFPVVALSGHYGVIGNEAMQNDRRTGGLMVAATMPLFDGRRIAGEVKESLSRQRQAELARDDGARQVEEDVRKALWTLSDALDQVDTSVVVVRLAGQEMDLASHRYAQGVSDFIEVMNAQSSLAQAQDAYISALAQYHAARMNLYSALGQPEAFILKDAVTVKENK